VGSFCDIGDGGVAERLINALNKTPFNINEDGRMCKAGYKRTHLYCYFHASHPDSPSLCLRNNSDHGCTEKTCGQPFLMWFFLKHDLTSPFFATYLYYRTDEPIRSLSFTPVMRCEYLIPHNPVIPDSQHLDRAVLVCVALCRLLFQRVTSNLIVH
jgi:hypothetical protein